ncbi:hypothetical protein D3C80_747150 [compost metagenome]
MGQYLAERQGSVVLLDGHPLDDQAGFAHQRLQPVNRRVEVVQAHHNWPSATLQAWGEHRVDSQPRLNGSGGFQGGMEWPLDRTRRHDQHITFHGLQNTGQRLHCNIFRQGKYHCHGTLENSSVQQWRAQQIQLQAIQRVMRRSIVDTQRANAGLAQQPFEHSPYCPTPTQDNNFFTHSVTRLLKL